MIRGDIYLVDFDPSVGSEIRKRRPAVIISCNEANRHLKTITVVPFSSKIDKVFPFEVLVKRKDSNLEVDSKAKASQIRTVDKSRLTKYVGSLNDIIITQVENAIKLHLGIK